MLCVAVGPAKCILAEGRKVQQSHSGAQVHRAGMVWGAADALPKPQASYCGMVTQYALAD